HRERVVGEIDPILFVVPLEHREINDPAEGETVKIDEAEFATDPVACSTGKACEDLWLSSHEERGIARLKTKLQPKGFRPLSTDILRNRAGAALLVFAPEDVAEAGLALTLSPCIHTIAERAAASCLRRDG